MNKLPEVKTPALEGEYFSIEDFLRSPDYDHPPVFGPNCRCVSIVIDDPVIEGDAIAQRKVNGKTVGYKVEHEPG
jgi:hypothetical protein